MGAPIGSVRSRSDGINTVGTGEAAGAGVTAVHGVGRVSATNSSIARGRNRAGFE